jgi:hypothetical protein
MSKITTNLTNWDELPIIMNASDVGRVMRLSKPSTYELFNQSGFPVIRVSERRLVVAKDALQRWLVEQAKMSGDVNP